MKHLSVLRRILLLLCLIGAQHAALAHAYEHFSARGSLPVAESEHNGGGEHAIACADCLSAHSLNAAFPVTLPAPARDTLDHVFLASALVQAGACYLPEQRAHGPPPSL